jgi:hypothetical protein
MSLIVGRIQMTDEIKNKINIKFHIVKLYNVLTKSSVQEKDRSN